MKSIEIKGNSINDIINNFRKEYKVKDSELKYEIISKPSGGFLGLFGKKQAAIRFNVMSTEERVVLYIEQLMKLMGVEYKNIKARTEQKTVYVTINNAADAGFLIGKNGNMLEQLQYLANRTFENIPNLERIYLDTEDYRYRQEQTFLRPFISIIQGVKISGKSVTLEPMQGGERRIIHKYVEGDRALKTLTIGDGDQKRIVVMLSNQKEKEPVKPKSTLKPNLHTVKKPEPKPEPKPAAKSIPELTPSQRAQQSYNRHIKAHPITRPLQKPKKKPME